MTNPATDLTTDEVAETIRYAVRRYGVRWVLGQVKDGVRDGLEELEARVGSMRRWAMSVDALIAGMAQVEEGDR